METTMSSITLPLSLKAWLAIREMKDQDFAQQIGITNQTVTAWKSGRNTPRGEYIPKIESVLNVRFSDIKFETNA